MVFVAHRTRIENLDKWKKAYDSQIEQRKAAGVRSVQIFRNADDPHDQVLVLEFDTDEHARAHFASPGHHTRRGEEGAGRHGVPSRLGRSVRGHSPHASGCPLSDARSCCWERGRAPARRPIRRCRAVTHGALPETASGGSRGPHPPGVRRGEGRVPLAPRSETARAVACRAGGPRSDPPDRGLGRFASRRLPWWWHGAALLWGPTKATSTQCDRRPEFMAGRYRARPG